MIGTSDVPCVFYTSNRSATAFPFLPSLFTLSLFISQKFLPVNVILLLGRFFSRLLARTYTVLCNCFTRIVCFSIPTQARFDCTVRVCNIVPVSVRVIIVRRRPVPITIYTCIRNWNFSCRKDSLL